MISARKILIMGLPGSGKTTLARELSLLLGAVVFDGDELRDNINRDLGFSKADRREQAYRMGWLCNRVVEAGHSAIASFVCPTHRARQIFGPALIIWADRVKKSRFKDTDAIFEAPEVYDFRIGEDGSATTWALRIFQELVAAERAGSPMPGYSKGLAL